MNLYVRVYPDYALELILSTGKLRKRRTHLLINPNLHVKLAIAQQDDGGISLDPESLTHILYLERRCNSKETFKQTVRLAGLLNKPVITNEVSAEKLKKEGIPARQIRYFSNQEDVIANLAIEQVNFSVKDNATETKRVVPASNLAEEGYLVKAGNSLKSFFSSLPSSPALRNKISEKITTPLSLLNTGKIEPGNLQAIFLHWKTHTLLIPLEKSSAEDTEKWSKLYKPDIIIFPEITLAEVSMLELTTKHIVIVDAKHAKAKPIQIPQKYIPDYDYDIILGSSMEWIDIDLNSM